MRGFTDIHSHFLYGIDDGAQRKNDMEAMLDAAYADGISSIFATPHTTPGIQPLDHALFRQRLAEANAYCHMKRYAINLYAGAEVLYTPAIERYVIEGLLPTLSDSANVLLEFIPDVAFPEMKAAVEMLTRSGYRAILAHVERYDCMFHRSNIYRLKEECDVQYQMNCGPILKGTGIVKDYYLHSWLKHEVIDFIATDAHDTSKRPSRMKEAYAALRRRYRKTYVDRLFGLCSSDDI